jgi:hypothetical protein
MAAADVTEVDHGPIANSTDQATVEFQKPGACFLAGTLPVAVTSGS